MRLFCDAKIMVKTVEFPHKRLTHSNRFSEVSLSNWQIGTCRENW